MKSAHLRFALSAVAVIGAVAAPALAQQRLNPEQRIMMLEQQLAASRASAVRVEQRLDALERQLQQLINQGEVNGHRASVLESDFSKLRSDMDSRLTALESRPVPQAATTEAEPDDSAPPRQETTTKTVLVSPDANDSKEETEAAAADPGEDAYSEGYHLWRDGKYDQSITALRAFISGFPNHRRVSFAKNLIGRALLDKGQPRPAAEALLANYRSNPKGERAPDSLYYLGQALMELNQPAQACKAYSELEDVYGSEVRSDLKSLVDKAKTEARCS
ncbi:MAG TPA: tetratricopeptide repeat protein [Sphingomicrobium sp.]|nr:tetratricopeptide repeat protein [Sphingomicrobium sp.]